MYVFYKQGFLYVQNNADATTTQKMVDYFFDHQDQFTEEILINYTLDNFLNELAALVASLTVLNHLIRN